MPNPYLTFSSSSSFTLNVVDYYKYWDGTLEYSTDTTTWNTWNTVFDISSASDGTNHNLYLRGTGNTYITSINASSTKAHWVLTGSNISCSGNIENLLDYATVSLGNHPVMAAYTFFNLFRDNTNLISAPELPAITLASNCYYNMFSGCTSLTTAPSLPATTLSSNCYRYMFYNCSSLTTLPELPSTSLTTYCYGYMFAGCSLIKLSTTQDSTYTNAYRIPSEGTGIDATNALNNMFAATGGTFTGIPTINTTYYTSNTIIPAVEPTPTQPSASISIGTSALAKAFVGNSEISQMWLGNVKIYEKETTSGYSGNIARYDTYGATGIHTKIKFDTPPTSDDDYDSMTQVDGSIAGLTSYANKTKVYVWGYVSCVKINNVETSGGDIYSQATEVLLTGNYDIYLAYSAGGSN